MASTREKKTTSAAAGLPIPHLEGCPAVREETYEVEGPKGYVVISRCMDCAAFAAGKPTSEPTLGKE